jgi:hypothetical protein
MRTTPKGWVGGVKVLTLEPGDRLELGVAIGMPAQRRHPQGFPLVIVVPVEQLIDDMHADITTTVLHEIDDLGPGQVGPDQRLFRGTAGGVLDEDLAEVLVDLGVFLEFPFPTPAGLADPRRGPLGEILEVALPLADGLGIDAQDLRDVLDPPVAELGRLDGGVAPPVVLAERPVEGLHGAFDIRGIREGCGHGSGPPIRKDGTSPIILTNSADSGKLIPRRS